MARTRFCNVWEKSRFSDAQHRFNKISFPAFVRAWFLTFSDLRASSWLLSKAALAGAFQSHGKLSKGCKCIPRQTWTVQSNPTISRIVPNRSKQLRAFERPSAIEKLWKFQNFNWVWIRVKQPKTMHPRQSNAIQNVQILPCHLQRSSLQAGNLPNHGKLSRLVTAFQNNSELSRHPAPEASKTMKNIAQMESPWDCLCVSNAI